jgi:tRNA1(Val) A37 N6-methylase TrmN6
LKDAAKHRGEAGLHPWVHALAALVAPRGTLSLILPAALMGEAIALLHEARFGWLGVLPLWPRAGKPPKIVIIQARRGSGPSHIAAGLVLHGDGSAYTAEADAVLRGGGGLAL